MLCTLKNAGGEGAHRRPILDFRSSDAILAYVGGKDLARYAGKGVITPDHVIRVKPWPLIVPAPAADNLDAFKTAAQKAVQKFSANYQAYFARNKKRARRAAMHDPLPRVVLVPGLGLFGLGASAKDARIAADIAEATVEGITGAEAIGRFTAISEADMFDCEYWPLELAKLAPRKDLPLLGQVAAITGGGGAIGAATARAFAAAGAEVALLDIDAKAAARQAKSIGGSAIAVACDVTDTKSVRAAFDAVVAKFGGVDILVSNAGAAWQGRIGEVDEATLRKSFELNFFAHQKVAQAAVKIMLAQVNRRLPVVQRLQAGGEPRRRISAPTDCPRRRRCFWCGNTRSITAPTASAPMPSMPTASAPACSPTPSSSSVRRRAE